VRFDPIENVFDLTSSDEGATSLLPFFVWHITNSCRLKCPYCFAPKNEDSVDIHDIQKVLSTARELGVLKIDVSGGEPLLYAPLARLMDAIVVAGIPFTLTTSGTGRPATKRDLLERVRTLTRLIVSIDGPTAEIHDSLRGEGSWHEAVTLIRSVASSQRRRLLRINTVVTQDFLQTGCLPDMVDLAEELGVREWCLIETHPANEKAGLKKHAVSTREHRGIVEAAKEQAKSVRVISRSATLYSDYWVLHPSGELVQHTQGGKPGTSLNFMEDGNKKAIEKLLGNSRHGMPTKEV